MKSYYPFTICSCFSYSWTEARKNRRVMKVPKGMSDYQATWIVDDCDEAGEEEEDSCDDDDDDEDDHDAMIDAVMDEEDDSQVHNQHGKPGSSTWLFFGQTALLEC